MQLLQATIPTTVDVFNLACVKFGYFKVPPTHCKWNDKFITKFCTRQIKHIYGCYDYCQEPIEVDEKKLYLQFFFVYFYGLLLLQDNINSELCIH